MKKLFKISLILASTVFALCASNFAYASNLNIITNISEVKTGGLFTATILLDAESNPINTIEGDLGYDKSSIIIERVNIGNSLISFWVEKPVATKDGTIHFSGIIPGGVSVARGEVFSVIFRAVNASDTNLEISNANLYLNDGNGTKDKTTVKNASIKITQGERGGTEQIKLSDETIPEKFTVTRTKDPAIFDNKWFAVFSTQDKSSGIDHYEVCEFVKSDCIISDSPHLLNYQGPFYRIIVVAYDTDGNSRQVVLLSPSIILGIFILIVLILILIRYNMYYANRRQK